MLDQRDRGAASLGNRVGEVPDVFVAEEVPVLELFGPGDGGAVGDLLVTRTEADERADECAELERLFFAEVAALHDFELAAYRLADEEQVEQPDRARFLQALELRHDLALELRAVELDDEHLNRPVHRLAVAHPARIFRFCSANSSSVRMPCAFRSASCLSCWIESSETPRFGAGGGGACGGGAYCCCCCCCCCCWRSSICWSRYASSSRPCCVFLPAW